jgi:hypothetical protein
MRPAIVVSVELDPTAQAVEPPVKRTTRSLSAFWYEVV